MTNRTVAQGVDLLDIFSVPCKYFEGPHDIWHQHRVTARDEMYFQANKHAIHPALYGVSIVIAVSLPKLTLPRLN